MPLIVMVGLPCSGKTYWANKIAKFIREKDRDVIVVSDDDIVKDVNETFSSELEREITPSFCFQSIFRSAPQILLRR